MTTQHCESLLKLVSGEEDKNSLWSIPEDKAPVPDGFDS